MDGCSNSFRCYQLNVIKKESTCICDKKIVSKLKKNRSERSNIFLGRKTKWIESGYRLSKNAGLTKETRRLKKAYLKKIKNEVSFLQKENTALDQKCLEKVRRLHKLEAENLFLKSFINKNIAVRSLLITFNDLLRSEKLGNLWGNLENSSPGEPVER